MSYKRALGVVGALGLAAMAQQAQAVTLQDLINNGTPVVAGDKIFSDFTAGGSLAASAITVNFLDSSGVQFTGNWNTLTPGSNSAVIGYTISVDSASGNVISGANLFFGGQVIVNNGSAFVGETLTDLATNKDYSLQVYYDGPGGLADNLRSSVTIDPSTTTHNHGGATGGGGTGEHPYIVLNFIIKV